MLLNELHKAKSKYSVAQDLTTIWTERFGATNTNPGELESAESLNDSVSAVCRDSICPVVSI
jgi:hypothetical protein